MALFKLPRWLKTPQPLFILQIEGSVVRFVLRLGRRVLDFGFLSVPAYDSSSRAFDVPAVRSMLLARMGNIKADVAVLLPATVVHIDYLTVPVGLDGDELDYQTSRHITHELGLSLADVYYDWTQVHESGTQGQTIVLAVARQSEVAQYAQLLADTSFDLRWVCAEPLVWAEAYGVHGEKARYVVCKVERDGMHMYWFEDNGRIRVWSKNFDVAQMSLAGFEYSSSQSTGILRLPARFVVDEINHVLTQVLGEAEKNPLDSIYVLGTAVNWLDTLPSLQSSFGMPVRIVTLPSGDEHNGLGGLWQLSECILKEKQ